MRTTLEAHLGSHQVTRVVYGSIIGLALLVVVEADPPQTGVVIGWFLGTAVAVALAEVYSDVIGVETRERHPVGRADLAGMTEDALAVAFGVAFPDVFFVLAALGVLELDTAFAVAKWSGLALIGFYAYWAARFSGAGVVRSLVRATLISLVGAGLIALKVFLH